MSTLPVDPTFALQNANYNDAVQRKLSMDALRKRIGNGQTEEQKLRESCEGFESLFIQKMWEQMRKTLPKDGYLHGKDEETYQSMFDVELSKKMASAGGIGLADMLYDQLSQKLTNAARTTSGAALKAAQNRESAEQAGLVQNTDAKKMTLDSLYTPLDTVAVEPGSSNVEYEAMYSGENPDAQTPEEMPSLVNQALADLEVMVAQANPAQEAVLAGSMTNAVSPPQGKEPDAAVLAGESVPGPVIKQRFAPGENIEGQSWLSNHKVSARPSPVPKAVSLSNIEQRVALVNAGVEPTGLTPAANTEQAGAAGAVAVDKAMPSVAGTPDEAHQPPSVTMDSINGLQQAAAYAFDKPVKAQGMVENPTSWLPVNGEVVRPFGWEKTSAGSTWHNSVLIGAKAGEPVRAPLDGRVVFVGEKTGLGPSVVLEHAKGYQSVYGNVAAEGLAVGSTVAAGTDFAKVLSRPSAGAQGEDFALMQLLVKRGEMPLDPEKTLERIAAAGR